MTSGDSEKHIWNLTVWTNHQPSLAYTLFYFYSHLGKVWFGLHLVHACDVSPIWDNAHYIVCIIQHKKEKRKKCVTCSTMSLWQNGVARGWTWIGGPLNDQEVRDICNLTRRVYYMP